MRHALCQCLALIATRADVLLLRPARPLAEVMRMIEEIGGMPFWQRLIATLVAMMLVSLVVGLIWDALFAFPLPSYLAGLVGGLTALPVWEFLKRVGPKQPREP